MNLDRAYIFSCVEEDNIQRAYFRIHPLLTIEGNVMEEANTLWPNNGCLRIVPDRAEQHTFKDRMRSMKGWCVVDLSAFAPEANKIRTNKNFHPDRGETNQYILYSDAVKAVPEKVFYEVLEGSENDYEALAEQAVTPRFYIRNEDILWGPIDRAKPEKPNAASEAEAVLYLVTSPDQKEHTILCIPAELVSETKKDNKETCDSKEKESKDRCPSKAESAAAPVAEAAVSSSPIESEALPIGKPLQILDHQQSFEETLDALNQPVSSSANLLKQDRSQQAETQPAVQLNGTPLIRTPMHTSIPQPKNRLQEVISSQCRVVRNDPPCEPLPAGCAMKQIDNPVQTACDALRAAWSVPEAQAQLINCILSLDGMTAKLEPKTISHVGNSPLQDAIQTRLTALEAERLSALVELDKARADVEANRKEAISEASGKAKRELEKLEKNRDEMQKSVEQLKQQTNALIAQRNELAKRIEELSSQEIPSRVMQLFADCAVTVPVNSAALRMNPVCGNDADLDEMTGRIEALCRACGINYARNRAIALLVVMAVSDRVGLTCTAPAAAATFVRNLCAAMGWSSGFAQQVTIEQRPLLASKPVDATPAILLTSLASYAPLQGVCKLLLSRNVGAMTRNAAYETEQWPIIPMGISKYVPEVAAPDASPVSYASLKALLDCDRTPDEEIDIVLAPVLKLVPPLSGRTKMELRSFVSVCAHLMDGGLSSACDWAIVMWVLPGLERMGRNISEMKAALKEYPLSSELLGN